MRAAILLACCAFVAGCGDSPTGPGELVGTYMLIEENGDPVPSDPSAPFGCCLTLSGTLTLSATTYDLRTTHRNKNNGIEFENSEQGTWVLDGGRVVFTRTGGGGEGFPYLLDAADVEDGGGTLVLRYGDEGPGSDQIVAVYARD